MDIIVTGGIGQIGKTAVAHLLQQGHGVRILDRAAEVDIDPEILEKIVGAEYSQVDITNYSSLEPYFSGVDAVVHLAALTYPGAGPGQDLFNINVTGTFNIYQAAANAGIQRVVCASSINALGYNYGIKSFEIEYFPIDEEHPTFTTDAYSFSKTMVEEVAGYFWRREGISGTALRFPAVLNPDFMRRRRSGFDFRKMFMEAVEKFSSLSEEERRNRMAAVVAEQEARRGERLHELPPEEMRQYWQERRQQGPPPPEMMLSWGRTDFWAILDHRDAAQAIEKAVTADYIGAHKLFITDSHNSLGLPSRDLVTYCFPNVKTWKRLVEGSESLVSIDKARSLIGYEPVYSFSERWTQE